MDSEVASRIVLGTAQMGLDYGVNNKSGQISRMDAFEILNRAFTQGITSLDTAAAYGNAHEIIGQFHKDFGDQKFKINTKFPHIFSESITDLVNIYLDQLEVSQIDTLFFHSFESFLMHSDSKEQLLALKEKNKIKSIGVSVYTNTEAQEVIDQNWIDVIQLPYNLLDNKSLRGDIIDSAKEKGKKVQIRSVFLQGLFFIDKNENHPIANKLKEGLDLIDEIAMVNSITKYELAILYCLSNKNIDQVLIGVDSLKQINELFLIKRLELQKSIIEKIDLIHTENIDLLNPSMWNKI